MFTIKVWGGVNDGWELKVITVPAIVYKVSEIKTPFPKTCTTPLDIWSAVAVWITYCVTAVAVAAGKVVVAIGVEPENYCGKLKTLLEDTDVASPNSLNIESFSSRLTILFE